MRKYSRCVIIALPSAQIEFTARIHRSLGACCGDRHQKFRNFLPLNCMSRRMQPHFLKLIKPAITAVTALKPRAMDASPLLSCCGNTNISYFLVSKMLPTGVFLNLRKVSRLHWSFIVICLYQFVCCTRIHNVKDLYLPKRRRTDQPF